MSATKSGVVAIPLAMLVTTVCVYQKIPLCRHQRHRWSLSVCTRKYHCADTSVTDGPSLCVPENTTVQTPASQMVPLCVYQKIPLCRHQRHRWSLSVCTRKYHCADTSVTDGPSLCVPENTTVQTPASQMVPLCVYQKIPLCRHQRRRWFLSLCPCTRQTCCALM